MYLGGDDFELVLPPVVVGQAQCLYIGIRPHPKALPEPLQAHLQSGNLVALAQIGLESGGDILPGKAFLILELEEQLVLLAELLSLQAGAMAT